ncbi:hypothetical protein Glove_300g111 [Diversispora epigaea]|uniref:C2H2-type domain-containing protein n=1 Tax=Diversispora epigaea TaxID=1348612 RepID=A0A397HXB4_9GLOM|nr:hypothetical protein Glove_300g111 [Diversispora epigaea]
MSRNFKCTFCENYYSTLNGLSQHLKRCKQTFYSSTEESNEEVSEIISDINDMSLDSEEFQSVLEGLPSSSKTRENPSQDLYEFEECEEYDGDISLISQPNIIQDSEMFEEILNFEEPENPELIEEVLQSQSNEELRNSEFFEERFRSIEESEIEEPEIEEPEIEINEFPNEAYADLMTLVTKHNLNNKASNAIIKFFNKHSNVSVSPLPKNIVVGRRYMDKMNSRLSYHKHSILSHNNVEYFIHYCPIVNCIENLLSNPEITKHFAYDYEDLTFEGEKSYGEQFTGNWWKSVNASIPSVAKVLSIILYSDATTLDTLGKSSLHPIYISLGNIPTWRRNKEDAKQLLGYLPIISAKDETEKKSSEFKILVRKTFHNSIKFLLEPLFENASIDLKIDGKRIWFYPRISTVICDWPEACTFSLTYKSSNSNYPCHFCLVSKDNLANTCLRKNQAVLRNKENMKKYYDNDTTKEASLEPVYNYFWDIPDLNIYDATVPDRMHHLDLGLYHYQIEFTKELLSKSSIDKFNRRIAEIPRHPEESNEEVSEIISDINDMSLDSEEFQSVLEGLPSSSKTRENPSQDLYEFEECEEYDGDISLISQPNIIQDSEMFEEILNFEEPENPELIEEVLQSQSNEELRNSEFFEERFRSIEESEIEEPEIEEPEIEINEFPNEAYADLMTLVTKHNLNNKASNAIIKFFNKHSNVSVSPLPKNIVVGRRYMDKMNSRLSYHKHSILSHNNVEYFIHYCPIVNCIENLLSNPEITKHFAYDYEDLTFEGEKSYGEQFTGNWWKSVNASIPSVAKVLSIILIGWYF